MSSPERAHALRVAQAELRSCYTIIADPQCDPSTGLVHLRRAWEALAWLSRGELPEQQPGESLAAWLAPEHLELLPKARREALFASLSLACAQGEAASPWADGAGQGEGHGKGQPELPRARVLIAQLRALDKLVTALRDAEQGRPLKRQALLRWGMRGGFTLVLLGVFVAVALRPWQSEDIGPWRGAYYPSKKFEGTPELRREANIAFDWKLEPPMDTVPSDAFSARFDSCLVLEEATEVAFMLVSDDGSRLLIDGEIAVDNFNKGKRVRKVGSVKGEYVELEAGVHHLRVEYFEDRTYAKLHLTASFDPDTAPGPIPAQLLEFPGMEIDEDSDADPCAGVSR